MHVLAGGGHAVEEQLHDAARRQLRVLAPQLQTHRHVSSRALHASGSVLDEIDREAAALAAALLLGTISKHVLVEGSTDVLVSTAREA